MALKFLLDENIGVPVAELLRKDGFDVRCIADESPGIKDQAVLLRSQTDGRILVTLDKDFGMLIYRDSHKHVGVILLRLHKESIMQIYSTLSEVFNRYGDQIAGKFVTATETEVRLR